MTPDEAEQEAMALRYARLDESWRDEWQRVGEDTAALEQGREPYVLSEWE